MMMTLMIITLQQWLCLPRSTKRVMTQMIVANRQINNKWIFSLSLFLFKIAMISAWKSLFNIHEEMSPYIPPYSQNQIWLHLKRVSSPISWVGECNQSVEPGGCDVEHVETSASLLKTFIFYHFCIYMLRLLSFLFLGKNVHLARTLIFYICSSVCIIYSINGNWQL